MSGVTIRLDEATPLFERVRSAAVAKGLALVAARAVGVADVGKVECDGSFSIHDSTFSYDAVGRTEALNIGGILAKDDLASSLNTKFSVKGAGTSLRSLHALAKIEAELPKLSEIQHLVNQSFQSVDISFSRVQHLLLFCIHSSCYTFQYKGNALFNGTQWRSQLMGHHIHKIIFLF